MVCFLCFTPGGLERRIDKKGRFYYTCTLCHHRLWIHSDCQAFGVMFWSKLLSDGQIVTAARQDMERVLAQQALDQEQIGRLGAPVATEVPATTGAITSIPTRIDSAQGEQT
jgi:hypothetical protein